VLAEPAPLLLRTPLSHPRLTRSRHTVAFHSAVDIPVLGVLVPLEVSLGVEDSLANTSVVNLTTSDCPLVSEAMEASPR